MTQVPDAFDPPVGQPGVPAEPVIVRIGELAVTPSTIHTPAGGIPLQGSTWQVADHWTAEQKIPVWAIVLAVVGFCVLTFFSLFFLLARKTVYHGIVQITVSNGAAQYIARLPVRAQAEVQAIHQQVNYVRSLAAL